MFRRALIRAPRNPLFGFRKSPTRPYSTPPTPTPASSQSRIERFNRRLPRFLHTYTNALATAPLTYITAFLILHELTAIIPLFGLAATFHYTHWLPSWFAEGAFVLQGVERFGRYFRKKGWIRSEEAAAAGEEVRLERRRRDKAWDISEGGVRVVVEFATAYAITKVLLPLRIMLSVWGTPWFATRTVIPLANRFKRLFARKGKKIEAPAKNAAGTGAVDAGAVPKMGAGNGGSKS